MANLLTNHDRYHSHAIFGLLALLHFLWRFVQVLRFGTSFPPEESRLFQAAGVLVHLIVALLSFQLPLPRKRNFSKPMIWPEFRLHSLVFSSRHILATLISLGGCWPFQSAGDEQPFSTRWLFLLSADILSKAILVMATSQLAKQVSKHFGSEQKRTTNSMSYPPHIGMEAQRQIKRGYSTAQFAATSMCLVGTDATAAFWPLVAIQGAVFLMTLVRKNYISALSYHRVYAIQLMLNFWVYAIRVYQGTIGYEQLFACNMGIFVIQRLRIVYGFTALRTWAVGVVLQVLGWALLGQIWSYILTLNLSVDAVDMSSRILQVLAVFGCLPLDYFPLFPSNRLRKTI